MSKNLNISQYILTGYRKWHTLLFGECKGMTPMKELFTIASKIIHVFGLASPLSEVYPNDIMEKCKKIFAWNYLLQQYL